MRLLRASKDNVQFYLGNREKQWLLETLKLYPRIPSNYQRLSRSGRLPEPDASQRLLDEALAEQRAENKKQLRALLESPRRFAAHEGGWSLSLSLPELEWLLQILNDIRVGSWIILGSPEEKIRSLNKQTAPHFWAMETAGLFQMQLLEGLSGGAPEP